jgi:hypothetical protein
MRFWDDMQSKWGFNDGEAIPEGVEAYRTVYIRAVNRFAEQLDSQVRAVAYNRFGVHNFCLVIFHNLTDLQEVLVEQYTEHVDIRAEVVEPDEAMREAIWQAQTRELDDLIEVTVAIAPGLEDFLNELKPDDADSPLILAGDPPEAD